MKIELIKLGKHTDPEVRKLVEKYAKRLEKFADFKARELKQLEKRLIPPVDATTRLVLLDERGQGWSSEQLAKNLQKWLDAPEVKNLVFLVGDPYGFDAEMKKAVKTHWALSPATIPSDLAWLLGTEQLYRAFSILKNFPYHHA